MLHRHHGASSLAVRICSTLGLSVSLLGSPQSLRIPVDLRTQSGDVISRFGPRSDAHCFELVVTKQSQA
jgi:hypothetical protein